MLLKLSKIVFHKRREGAIKTEPIEKDLPIAIEEEDGTRVSELLQVLHAAGRDIAFSAACQAGVNLDELEDYVQGKKLLLACSSVLQAFVRAVDPIMYHLEMERPLYRQEVLAAIIEIQSGSTTGLAKKIGVPEILIIKILGGLIPKRLD